MLLLFQGCATAPLTSYPAHWWTPAEDPHKPAWEILPGDAAQGHVILSKRNELGILSNFAPTPFTLDGVRYASVEGFWQMMKYPDGPDDPRAKLGPWPHTRGGVAAMSAFEAKRAGKAASRILKDANIDWVSYQGKRLHYKGADLDRHYQLIRRAMAAKLAQNADVGWVLKATGDLSLLPDHHQSKRKTKSYDYHRIWMALRDQMTPPSEAFLSQWSVQTRPHIVRAVTSSVYTPNRIAVFDGDGTLWQADLPREFLEFQIKHRRLLNFDYGHDAGAARLYRTCKHDVSICIAQAAFLYVGLSLVELKVHAAEFLKQGFEHRVFTAQQQLIAYLRSRGFTIYVVSGGPQWLAAEAAQRYFNIPPSQVIGVQTRLTQDGFVTAEVVPPLPFRKGKVDAIASVIGRAPQIVVGNSKSDVPMLQTAQKLSIAVHSFGSDHPGFHYKSEQALKQEAGKRGWVVQKLNLDVP